MFSSLLPRPKHSTYTKAITLEPVASASQSLVALPRENAGSVVQNPNTNNTISKYHLNSDGTLNYGLTIASAHSERRFHASYEDTIPLKTRFPKLKHFFPRSEDDEMVKNCIEDTRAVVQQLLREKLGPVEQSDEPEFVKYTSSNIDEERGRETVIQVKNYQQDPMLPPKHKLRKNRHQDPSPPPPILKHAKTAKLTKEDQAKWKIPSAISNWKNNQGFTISLDKRMISATGSETPHVNLEKLGGLSSALEDADKQAREEIKIRNELRKEMQLKQEREKEMKLQELAEMTRNARSKRSYDQPYGSDRKRKH